MDNYFTILCWFLPYINMNQPQVYVCPLLLGPSIPILEIIYLLREFRIFPFPHLSIDSTLLLFVFSLSIVIIQWEKSPPCLPESLSSWVLVLRSTFGKQHGKKIPASHFLCCSGLHHMQLYYTELNYTPSNPFASLVAQRYVCLQCGRPGFNPWVGKIPFIYPGRRKWQPAPVFLPG